MTTKNKLSRLYAQRVQLFRLWRQLAKASLTSWWVTKGKPYSLKLKTVVKRRLNAD